MPDPELTTLPLLTSTTEFEDWLAANGETASEYWVRFYKKSSPHFTVELPALIEVALCYGWIDVKGRRVDDDLRAIRFTPRRPKSNWSDINRAAAKRLIAGGRMQASGFAKLPPDL